METTLKVLEEAKDFYRRVGEALSKLNDFPPYKTLDEVERDNLEDLKTKSSLSF